MLLLAGAWFGYRWWKKEDLGMSQWESRKETPQERKKVTLFFSDEQAEFLVGETREVEDPGTVDGLAGVLLQELLRGPQGGLQPTIPAGTRLLAPVSCSEGICKVNFSQELVTRHPGGTSGEMMTIYSVVETLCENLPKVKRVQFLVEGKPRETLAGHLFIGAAVAPEPGLSKRDAWQKP
ncbi:MAG: GerMN domain-containing protein [bacterium]